MKNGEYLLDTNIVIALFAQEPSIIMRIGQVNSILIPAIVLGELYFGASQSARSQENIARIQALQNQVPTINVNEQTAVEYGQIKANLKKKGRPIPENDLWISALAKQHGYIVASRDKHLLSIEEIQTEVW
ncbi:MAG: type II toxin-antitoxin system VapC family toxin [Candidatus Sericytochromatia bacterium]